MTGTSLYSGCGAGWPAVLCSWVMVTVGMVTNQYRVYSVTYMTGTSLYSGCGAGWPAVLCSWVMVTVGMYLLIITCLFSTRSPVRNSIEFKSLITLIQ